MTFRWRFQRGKRVALLGANGSGKSTLLRLLDGLYFPDSGSISFDGQALGRRTARGRPVCLRFPPPRRPGLPESRCAALQSHGVRRGGLRASAASLLERDEIVHRVEATLALMEIGHLKNRPPHRLSGGEKKRVALASVLVLDPEVLLLDEPTAALDPRSQSQIIDLLIGWGDGSKIDRYRDARSRPGGGYRRLLFPPATRQAGGRRPARRPAARPGAAGARQPGARTSSSPHRRRPYALAPAHPSAFAPASARVASRQGALERARREGPRLGALRRGRASARLTAEVGR